MKRITLLLLMIFTVTPAAFAQYSLITDGAGTMGRGKLQLEAGVSYYYAKNDIDEITTLRQEGAEASLCVTAGLLDNLDAIVDIPYDWFSVRENDRLADREDGFADIDVNLKWRFFEKEGWSLALKPGLSLPSGSESKGLGPGRTGYRLFFIASKEFQKISMDFNLGYLRRENSTDDRENIWHVSWAAQFAIFKDWKLLADAGCERNPEPGNNAHPAFILGGLSYSLTESVLIDAGVKYGLTSAQSDITLTAGITMTF